MEKTIRLFGRVLISGEIHTLTGLRIGGSASALSIGGLDLPVIRNGMDDRPYIPGSSLKGKMRSLAEKLTGAPQNKDIGGVKIHVAGGDRPRGNNQQELEAYQKRGEEEYYKYWVNPLFGVPGEISFGIDGPTRLLVRDVFLTEVSAEKLLNARTEVPYAEVKTEVAIDRVTSQATPRQVERVPAGAVFGPMELSISIFTSSDLDLIAHVLTALDLVEDDYLGGHGSRGSGRVAFRNLSLVAKRSDDYSNPRTYPTQGVDLSALIQDRDEILAWLKDKIPVDGGS
jgi:CRISPR-associated protein Csm3